MTKPDMERLAEMMARSLNAQFQIDEQGYDFLLVLAHRGRDLSVNLSNVPLASQIALCIAGLASACATLGLDLFSRARLIATAAEAVGLESILTQGRRVVPDA